MALNFGVKDHKIRICIRKLRKRRRMRGRSKKNGEFDGFKNFWIKNREEEIAYKFENS